MDAEGMLEPAIPTSQVAAFREVAEEHLNASLARSEAFERRATTLLGVVTASLTILLAAAGVRVGSGLRFWGLVPAAVGVACLVTGAFYCVAVLRPRDVRVVAAARITKLWQAQRAKPGDSNVQVWAEVLNNMIDSATTRPEEAGAETARADTATPPWKVSVLQAATDEAASRGTQFGRATWWVAAGLAFLGVAVIAELGARMVR